MDRQFSNPSNISANELDDETNSKLRGDAIGDTLYSQSFVLKTLLRFADVEWNEELEEDLCFLWDMTVEKDVCKFLFDLSFPSLACSSITKCTENRFIEIVIGILANILCADCEKNITEAEICIILQELDTEDPLILIQIARFISVIAHISNELLFISKNVMDKIEFILHNSTNDELLLKTLEAVAKLTTDFKLDKSLVNLELLNSSLNAYQSVMTGDGDSDEFMLDTRDKQLTCKHMLEVVSNVCAYVDQFEDTETLVNLRKHSNVFTKEVIKILNYFSNEENLFPITDEFIFYMSVFKFVFEILSVNYTSELFLPLTKIFIMLLTMDEAIEDLFESVLDLEIFLSSNCMTNILYHDLKQLPKADARKLLNVLNENKHKFVNCEVNIKRLLDKFK